MGSQSSFAELFPSPFSRFEKSSHFKMTGGQWKNGMFGCFDNIGNCCCVYCCYPCAVYRDAEDLNKSGVLYGFLACLFPCIPTFLLRGETREKYGIEGVPLKMLWLHFVVTLVFSVKLEMKSKNVEIDPNFSTCPKKFSIFNFHGKNNQTCKYR